MKTIAIFNKTITLGLDYSQFTGGISEVNRNMKLVDAEFNKAKEELKQYGEESDLARITNEKLTQQIILQQKKVELSKQALEKATASGKANQKQLDNLKLALTKSETELLKMNNALEENTKNEEEATEAHKSFGDEIRGVASSLGLDVNPAVEALASKFDGVSKEVGNCITLIGAIGGAFVKCSMDAANYADELVTLSSVTSISTDTLQKFEYASNLVDVSMDSLSDALKEVTNKMKEARNGSEDAQKAFKKLHVEYKDGGGNLMNAEQTFYKLIDALGKIKNETERDALAMSVFGESARNLNPLIEAGSKRLKELGVEAEDLGLIMSGESLDELVAYKDAMDKFDVVSKKAKMTLGTALVPILTMLTDVIGKIPAPVMAGVIAFVAISSIMLSVVRAATSLATANALLSVSNTTVGATGMLASTGMGPLLLILLAIAAVIAVVVGKMTQLKSAISDTQNQAQQLINSSGEMVGKMTDAASKSQTYKQATKYRAFGDNYTQGGEYIVGENGPEIVRIGRGHQIVSNQDLQSQGNVYIQNVVVQAKDMQEADQATRTLMSLRQERRRM